MTGGNWGVSLKAGDPCGLGCWNTAFGWYSTKTKEMIPKNILKYFLEQATRICGPYSHLKDLYIKNPLTQSAGSCFFNRNILNGSQIENGFTFSTSVLQSFLLKHLHCWKQGLLHILQLWLFQPNVSNGTLKQLKYLLKRDRR